MAKDDAQKKIEVLEAELAEAHKVHKEALNDILRLQDEKGELRKGKEEALRDVGRLTKELAEEKSARTRAENALAEVEKDYEAKALELEDSERGLTAALKALHDGEEKADPLPEVPEELLQEALDAYDIDAKYVLSTGIDAITGALVIVTAGGKKVRYFEGDEVEPLSEVEVTGVNKARRKTGRK